eukprot:scaffold63728_cov46-Attheya_sp.AAC.1
MAIHGPTAWTRTGNQTNQNTFVWENGVAGVATIECLSTLTRKARVSTSREEDTDTPHTQAPSSSSDQQLAMSSLNLSDMNVGVNQDSMTELDVIGCKDSTYESPRLKILVQQKRGRLVLHRARVRRGPKRYDSTPQSLSKKPVNFQLWTYVKPENDDTL